MVIDFRTETLVSHQSCQWTAASIVICLVLIYFKPSIAGIFSLKLVSNSVLGGVASQVRGLILWLHPRGLLQTWLALNLFCYFFLYYTHISWHRELPHVPTHAFILANRSLRFAWRESLYAHSSIIRFPWRLPELTSYLKQTSFCYCGTENNLIKRSWQWFLFMELTRRIILGHGLTTVVIYSKLKSGFM